MAIINPRNLYSGGDAVLNANPYTNFFITALARKQAQQDSLDQYYRNTQDRLSQNQIRPIDAEGFQNKFAGLQNYYLQNKKAILSGNVAANSQYEQQYRDLISDAQKSKAAAGQELLMAQHHFSGKWQPTDEDFHTVIPAMSASIYDAKHYKDQTMTTPYGVNDTSVYTPDLDEKKYLQTITFGQKPSETPTGQPENLGGFRRRQNYQVGYNDQQLKNFGDKAMSDAATNPSVKKLASNRYDFVDLNPAMKENLNNTFKQYYGKDAQSPSDFYAAEVINNLSPKETKTKEYEDAAARTQYTQNRIDARARLSDAYQKGRMEFGKQLKDESQTEANKWIDDFIDGLAADAKNTAPVPYKTSKGDVSNEHIIPLDATMAKALAKDGIQPDQLRVTEDGSFRPVWFKRNTTTHEVETSKNGMAAVDEIRSTPISQDQVKLALGKTAAGTKQLNVEMKQTPHKKEKLNW